VDSGDPTTRDARPEDSASEDDFTSPTVDAPDSSDGASTDAADDSGDERGPSDATGLCPVVDVVEGSIVPPPRPCVDDAAGPPH
jgi:hypothetical protein